MLSVADFDGVVSVADFGLRAGPDGDLVLLDTPDGRTFTYQVDRTVIVQPDDLSVSVAAAATAAATGTANGDSTTSPGFDQSCTTRSIRPS